MGKFVFDEELLRDKIAEGELALQKTDLSSDSRYNIKHMIEKFNQYLGNEEVTQEKPLTKNEMLYELNKKMKSDLQFSRLRHWEQLADICDECIIDSLPCNNSNHLSGNENDIINAALEFYKSLDPKFYNIALKIIHHPNSLINLEGNKNLTNHCYNCKYIGLPLINICEEGDFKYEVFIHELEHAIDFLNYGFNMSILYAETGAMFSEIIFTDRMMNLCDCKNFYSRRINDNNIQMKRLLMYAGILKRFKKYGSNINYGNYSEILHLDNYNNFTDMFNYLDNKDYSLSYKYIISFMRSIQLRNLYYSYPAYSLEMLDNDLKGLTYRMNFKRLKNEYSQYTEEVKTLYKNKNL